MENRIINLIQELEFLVAEGLHGRAVGETISSVKYDDFGKQILVSYGAKNSVVVLSKLIRENGFRANTLEDVLRICSSYGWDALGDCFYTGIKKTRVMTSHLKNILEGVPLYSMWSGCFVTNVTYEASRNIIIEVDNKEEFDLDYMLSRGNTFSDKSQKDIEDVLCKFGYKTTPEYPLLENLNNILVGVPITSQESEIDSVSCVYKDEGIIFVDTVLGCTISLVDLLAKEVVDKVTLLCIKKIVDSDPKLSEQYRNLRSQKLFVQDREPKSPLELVKEALVGKSFYARGPLRKVEVLNIVEVEGRYRVNFKESSMWLSLFKDAYSVNKEDYNIINVLLDEELIDKGVMEDLVKKEEPKTPLEIIKEAMVGKFYHPRCFGEKVELLGVYEREDDYEIHTTGDFINLQRFLNKYFVEKETYEIVTNLLKEKKGREVWYKDETPAKTLTEEHRGNLTDEASMKEVRKSIYVKYNIDRRLLLLIQ